jgi:RNA polymerase sigma-70 factor (ECF subfamily)
MRSQSTYRDEYLAAYDEYADAVFRMCYSKTSSREEAKDMTQEVFTRVWQRIESGKEDVENLRAFLFTVARNLIKDYYKKKKPVLERDLPEGTFEAFPTAPLQSMESESALMLEALTGLADSYREVLMLHLVEGIPIGEIAEMLGERPNTISVRVKRGIEKVRTTLHIEETP